VSLFFCPELFQVRDEKFSKNVVSECPKRAAWEITTIIAWVKIK